MSQMSPKRTKFRKQQKGKNRGLAWRGSDVSFGDFALQAVAGSHLTSRQIEAGRMAIQRHVKRAGKLWIRIFPGLTDSFRRRRRAPGRSRSTRRRSGAGR